MDLTFGQLLEQESKEKAKNVEVFFKVKNFASFR
jgi:hypothetical protein